MKNFIVVFIVITFLQSTVSSAAKIDHLQACYAKQVKAVGAKFLSLTFSEQTHQLYHSFEPWMTLRKNISGNIWVNATSFTKRDSFVGRTKTYYSNTQLDHDLLLTMGYGDTAVAEITNDDFMDAMVMTARYNPLYLLEYVVRRRISPSTSSTGEFEQYTLTINKTIVTLSIRTSDDLLDHITTTEQHNLYGDLVANYFYRGYKNANALHFPTFVEIVQLGGNVRDTVIISLASYSDTTPTLMIIPKNYHPGEAAVPKPTEISTEHYNAHIHFVNLQPANMKSMIVEFKDFLLVAEAPHTSSNDELIIEEAKKIAPKKPIKYFAFGHFHPHYLGGVRAFVHKHATILCPEGDKEYLKFIVDANRTMEPDSLQLQPRQLLMQEVKDSMTISDDSVTLTIYVIGKKSTHAKDFMVYYFPKEHLLFEDELTWIPETPPIKKASDRQAGLYHAIKDLGINVETIIRSWPITGYKLKSIIPFSEVEESMKVQ